MRAVIQRVSKAQLFVEGKLVSQIGNGLVVYVGFGAEDTDAVIAPFCKKVSALRIFSDDAGKMNLSVRDIGGKILLVSNFTLYANISHGNRPDFMSAMQPDSAKRMFERCAQTLKEFIDTECGVFGADMYIDQTNAGPVTIIY